MPFLFLGLFILFIFLLLLRRAIKRNSREEIVGLFFILLAGLILTLFFGVFYRGLMTL